ncbi:MAG: TIGR00300 family protein [Desulfobacteraceae bacterium]|nr:MAG: TIGR00300 family protein [Desulfobacteraceae bacterium]
MKKHTQIFVSEGHLIDSGIMTKILNLIVAEQAEYQVLKFEMGRNNLAPSHLEIEVRCDQAEKFETLTAKLVNLGCYEKITKEAVLKPAGKDATVPDDFYSSTNLKTLVYHENKWHEVEGQRMDGVLVFEQGRFKCRKLRNVKKGDAVVCGSDSIRLIPEFRERSSEEFGFMLNDVSSERSVRVTIEKIAQEIKRIRAQGGKIIVVSGPVVIHTGGAGALAALIRNDYVQGLLTGNALAVHDIEAVLYGTSLGIDLQTGKPVDEGHRNHMRAINQINHYGSIAAAVAAGLLTDGVMQAVIQKKIPYVLAGSLRDDGPLPETVTDMIEAQEQYQAIVKEAAMIIMLSSMLHSIATGNMIPARIKTICVDINPAVVTKLIDRGSAQAIGVVTDVGLFVRSLAEKLGVL